MRCGREGGAVIGIFTWLHGEESSLLSPRGGFRHADGLAEVHAPVVRLHVGHGEPATGVGRLGRQRAVVGAAPFHLGAPGALIPAAEHHLLALFYCLTLRIDPDVDASIWGTVRFIGEVRTVKAPIAALGALNALGIGAYVLPRLACPTTTPVFVRSVPAMVLPITTVAQ